MQTENKLNFGKVTTKLTNVAWQKNIMPVEESEVQTGSWCLYSIAQWWLFPGYLGEQKNIAALGFTMLLSYQ